MNPEFLSVTGLQTKPITVDTEDGDLVVVEVALAEFDAIISAENLFGIPAYLEDN